MSAVELRGVEKSFAPGQPVLTDVNLTLPAGSLTWLGGANGAGKTTILRVITGVLAPDRGTVRLHGLDPVADRHRYHRALGFLPAGNAGLYARLTVRQHLDIWARVAFVPKHAHRGRINAVVRRFGLDELVDRRCDRLSMGQRQRLRLGMAFIGRPRVVVLDEPQTSLDHAGRDLLCDVLEAFAASGGAALWCSPDRDDIPLEPDQRQILATGRLHDVSPVA